MMRGSALARAAPHQCAAPHRIRRILCGVHDRPAWRGVDVHCVQHTPSRHTVVCRAALRLFAALSLVDDDVAAEFKARLLATDLVLYTLRALATCMVRPVHMPQAVRAWHTARHAARAQPPRASDASHY